MSRLVAAVRERLGEAGAPGPASVPGGASIAYALGAVLLFLLGLQVATGLALAAFYSPSATDAWGSVAYLEDQVAGGWLVRALHTHGASALVVVAGIHLVQTAVVGAYRRPRELVWWLGIALLVLILGWAITGYVLRWDQAGYWANRVEVGIAAGTPVLGGAIQQLALGGNDYGNLTLTRFYMLHVGLFPVLVGAAVYAHVRIARRHGPTPIRAGRAAPRWPHQTVRDAAAMAVAFAVVLAVAAATGGVGLAAPADPGEAYDARPLWYFRWLFELRELAGRAEQLAALAAPAVVAGFLIALPVVDRAPTGAGWGAARARRLWLGGLAGLLAAIAALTAMSFARDAGDAELAERSAAAAARAARARQLAAQYGVPASGAQDIWSMAPMWRGRTLFAKMCAGCHDAGSDPKERIGPVIGPGYGDRVWLREFLKAPSDPRFWGKTKLARTEAAMKPVSLPDDAIAALVELLIAESGEPDVDRAKVEQGKRELEACTDCHSYEEGVPGASGPGLFGLHSRAYYVSFIGNPRHPVHMGSLGEMPRFDADLSLADRDALAEYLVWLRTATAADVSRLGPL